MSDKPLAVDREQHRSYGDGIRRYFGVTTVCHAMTGDGVYGDESAMQRGTDLHVIFALAIGAFAGKCAPPQVPSSYQGYYHSMQTWIKRAKPEPILIERSSVSSFAHLPFAGTPDLLAKFLYCGKRVIGLVDLKSGQKAYWHHVQVTAYSKLALYREAQILGLLYLHEDGNEAVIERVKPNGRDWAAFQAALQLLIWREST